MVATAGHERGALVPDHNDARRRKRAGRFGDVDNTFGVNRLPQVWTDGNWRDLTDAQIQMDLYPMMLLAPDGRVFNPGPQQRARYIDTSGTGQWTDGASSSVPFRGYGTAVMYEPGKVLLVGGGDPPVASAEKIDLNNSSPQWQSAGAMNMPRRQLNATVLPDGTVLVTGGSSAPGFDNAAGAVLNGELWDPSANSFTQLATAPRYRGYHSTALLLPDGRVLSAGGDINSHNAELFSPPYLFKGPRPTVTASPSNITYGQPFVVQTPDAASISAVTLVRLSTVTHANNMNQRFVRLAFSAGAGRLTVTPPSAGEIAPPGHYMLFLLNSAGVPSVAPIVRLSADIVPSPPTAPTNLAASAVSSSQINLTWTDTANNETGIPHRAFARRDHVRRDRHRRRQRHQLCEHRAHGSHAILVSGPRLQQHRRVRLRRSGQRDHSRGRRGANGADESDGERRLEQSDQSDLDRHREQRNRVPHRAVARRDHRSPRSPPSAPTSPPTRTRG
jgi:hypothetical protein